MIFFLFFFFCMELREKEEETDEDHTEMLFKKIPHIQMSINSTLITAISIIGQRKGLCRPRIPESS